MIEVVPKKDQILISGVLDVEYRVVLPEIPLVAEDVCHVKFRDVESCHHQDAACDKLDIGRQ